MNRRAGWITSSRSSGWWLTAVRVVWLIAALLSVAFLAAEMQATLAVAKHLCPNASFLDCPNMQLTVQTAHALHGISMSPAQYTGYNLALLLLVSAVAYALAVVLMVRRSADRMVLVAAFACLFVNVNSFQSPGGMWTDVAPAISILSEVGVALFFFLFPSGRFVPRWAALFAAAYVACAFLPIVWLYLALYGFILLSVVAFQIYRYFRVSTPLQRQQTKLVVLGIGINASIFVATLITIAVDPDLQRQPVPFLVVQSALDLSALPILLAAGFAILRYRLWDVDVLINRSLVYGTLSASLAAVYIGSVIGLQALSQAVTGRQSDLAVAVSTLLIAALFNPLRHRIQRVIARIFYRRAYDAGRVLARFGERCRDETDLERLRGNLALVVEETMQPSGVSLWLLDPVEGSGP